jgi:hypothetical protein
MAHIVKEVDALVVVGGFGGIRLVHLLHAKLHLKNVVAIEKGRASAGPGIGTNTPEPRLTLRAGCTASLTTQSAHLEDTVLESGGSPGADRRHDEEDRRFEGLHL